MSAGVFAAFETSPVGPAQTLLPDIDVSVSVRAERRRLVQVLTVAEYLETWLSFPGPASDSRIVITNGPESFRIDHFRARELDFTITALYRMCRRSRLQLAWRKDAADGSSYSEVILTLRGDFERTTVALRHTRLRSFADFAWHQDFWEQSLKKLSSLF
jgi:hypothetical protein